MQQRSDLDRPSNMSKENVIFVAFTSDLVSYGLMEVLQVEWNSTHKSARRTFNELVGLAAVVFRHRHAGEFGDNIAGCPFYVLEDLENAVEYLQCFVRSNFQGLAPLMEVIVFFAFVLDLTVSCYENEKIEYIPEIVEESYDVYEEYIKPYFQVVGGWYALENMAEQYLDFVRSMNDYKLLVCSETEDTEEDICVVDDPNVTGTATVSSVDQDCHGNVDSVQRHFTKVDCPSNENSERDDCLINDHSVPRDFPTNVGSVRGNCSSNFDSVEDFTSDFGAAKKDCLSNDFNSRANCLGNSDQKNCPVDDESVKSDCSAIYGAIENELSSKLNDRSMFERPKINDCPTNTSSGLNGDSIIAGSVESKHPGIAGALKSDRPVNNSSTRKDCPMMFDNDCSMLIGANLENSIENVSVIEKDCQSNTSSPGDSPMDITYHSNDYQVTKSGNDIKIFNQPSSSTAKNYFATSSENNILNAVSGELKNDGLSSSTSNNDIKMDVSVDDNDTCRYKCVRGNYFHQNALPANANNSSVSCNADSEDSIKFPNTHRDDFRVPICASDDNNSSNNDFRMDVSECDVTDHGLRSDTISSISPDCSTSVVVNAHVTASDKENSSNTILVKDSKISN